MSLASSPLRQQGDPEISRKILYMVIEYSDPQSPPILWWLKLQFALDPTFKQARNEDPWQTEYNRARRNFWPQVIRPPVYIPTKNRDSV